MFTELLSHIETLVQEGIFIFKFLEPRSTLRKVFEWYWYSKSDKQNAI